MKILIDTECSATTCGCSTQHRDVLAAITNLGELIMASKEETLAAVEQVRAEAKAAEERAQTTIQGLLDAATTANASLQALVAELQARPDVPDDVTAKIEEVRADIADDFAPEAPPAA